MNNSDIRESRHRYGGRMRFALSGLAVQGKTLDEVIANIKLLAGDLAPTARFYISEMGDAIEFIEPHDENALKKD